jgi:proline iminopeptidase
VSEGSVVLSDGVSVWGRVEGSGLPVVLCHGGPGLWDYLDAVATVLRDEFTVHRWDQRGCGRSGLAPAYGLDVAVGDIQDLKRAWCAKDPWAIVGHSWGAELALLSTVMHPESTSALIYVSGRGLQSWWRKSGSARTRAEEARRLSPEAIARREDLAVIDRNNAEEAEFRRLSWAPDFVVQNPVPAALEDMVNTPLPINVAVNRALSRAQLLGEDELLAACERCDVPALFVHGSRDPRPSDGAHMMFERFPNARFVEIDGAGHLPWVERPVEFADAVLGFLRSAA